jgi:hypothetical protein
MSAIEPSVLFVAIVAGGGLGAFIGYLLKLKLLGMSIITLLGAAIVILILYGIKISI